MKFFWHFLAKKFFHQKKFSLLFRTKVFPIFRLSITSLCQVSSYSSTFLWFFASKNTYCQFFHPKFFLKVFFPHSFWLIFTDFLAITYHFRYSMLGFIDFSVIHAQKRHFLVQKLRFLLFRASLFSSKTFFHSHFTLIIADFLSYQPSL